MGQSFEQNTENNQVSKDSGHEEGAENLCQGVLGRLSGSRGRDIG